MEKDRPVKEKSIYVNYIFNMMKTFSSLLFPVITFTYSARILGADGVGQVNFAKSIITYFAMFAMLGMNYYGTREAAKVRDDPAKLSRFVQEMLLINGCTTVLSYILLWVTLFTVPRFQNYKTLLLINSVAILLQGMGMEWLYQALEEYRYISLRSIAFQIIALAAMFLFVRSREDVIPYAIVQVTATYGSYVLNFFHARKYVHFRRIYGPYHIAKHMKPLLYLTAMLVSVELYTVLDSTMLGIFQGDASVGMYTAAVKINKLVNTVITAAGVVLIPRLSYYIGCNEMQKVRQLVIKAYNYMFLLSVPAAVGLFMLSDEIIRLFSGSEFAAAGVTMRLLTPIVLVIPFSITTNQQTFIPMGKEKLMLFATSLGAVSNLMCNWYLIPQYAENGAAAATVLAESVVAVVSGINASRYFNMKEVFAVYWQYWAAALPIPIVVMLIRRMHMHYIAMMTLCIVVSILLYFGVLTLFRNKYLFEMCGIIRKELGRIRRAGAEK